MNIARAVLLTAAGLVGWASCGHHWLRVTPFNESVDLAVAAIGTVTCFVVGVVSAVVLAVVWPPDPGTPKGTIVRHKEVDLSPTYTVAVHVGILCGIVALTIDRHFLYPLAALFAVYVPLIGLREATAKAVVFTLLVILADGWGLGTAVLSTSAFIGVAVWIQREEARYPTCTR